jgi:hypothetical protein
MDWIKRNLYFLIGGLVAVALMGLAGWYLYSKYELNNSMLTQLDEQYGKLKRLSEQNPHPGNDKVDNIKAAKEQQQALRAYMQKAGQHFQTCPPIPVPESGKLTSQEFSSALSRTVDQMQRDASKASVELPGKDSHGNSYSFSFAAQRESLAYAAGSLQPLSVQLGEIKSICDVLFHAKINSLDSLRRERVSEDDAKGPQNDYLPDKSTTNELAVLSPYEVGFRCFSSELANVLAGFASAPCALLVKSINVEQAPATAVAADQTAAPVTPAYTPAPAPVAVAPPPPPPMPAAPGAEAAAFSRRYGLEGGRGAAPPPRPAPVYNPLPYTAPAASVNRGGLPLALDEKRLRITMMVYAVKLIPPTK